MSLSARCSCGVRLLVEVDVLGQVGRRRVGRGLRRSERNSAATASASFSSADSPTPASGSSAGATGSADGADCRPTPSATARPGRSKDGWSDCSSCEFGELDVGEVLVVDEVGAVGAVEVAGRSGLIDVTGVLSMSVKRSRTYPLDRHRVRAIPSRPSAACAQPRRRPAAATVSRRCRRRPSCRTQRPQRVQISRVRSVGRPVSALGWRRTRPTARSSLLGGRPPRRRTGIRRRPVDRCRDAPRAARADRGRCSPGAGRRSGRAASVGVVTPVSTSRLWQPTARAPSMSVSRRSPTTIGVRAPDRSTLSRCMVGSGLPVDTGTTPVAWRSAATSEPLPGSGPRGDGTVGSRLVATQSAPRLIAIAPSASSAQSVFGE